MEYLKLVGKTLYRVTMVCLMLTIMFTALHVGIYYKALVSADRAQLVAFEKTKVGLHNFIVELKSLDSKKVNEILKKYN